jgi:hypothetical protein
MGFGKSQASILDEWTSLLAGSEEEPRLADRPNRTRLAAIRARAFELLAEQAHHRAAKQVASQALNDLFNEGEDVARDFKAELRSEVGSRSERLAQYNLKPLRTGGRRKRTGRAAQESSEAPAALAPGAAGTPEPE